MANRPATTQSVDALAKKLRRTELQHHESSNIVMMIQGGAALQLRGGDGFLGATQLTRNALDAGPATVKMLSSYLVEAGAPSATFVVGP